MIQGESGTGKELVAEAIHFHSARSNGPFIRVNCAALSETLLASELFGHKKGAFTGANRNEKGRFRTADGGTLLLDEIGCMLPAGQAKLLRVLQAKEVEPVGESIPVKVDVRIIATTNLDLKRAVDKGIFREDLYYRLNVFPIHLLPLRERMDDLPLLVRHFLKRYARELKRQISSVSPSAFCIMENYDWPGNVRELENAVEYAVMLETEETLQPFSFMEKIIGASIREIHREPLNLRMKLGAVEKETILKALSHSGGVKSEAARLLGIDPKNLSYFLRKHGISDHRHAP
jgi:transcriptional regulator with GAF, ATPase, and Fis domain